jgi:GT2 family glycosyltransferase
MDLSIIIVNYRGWDDLASCLQSLAPLLKGETEPSTEVVVADNDSADDRLEAFAARFPETRFVTNSGNHGFAHGCNLGAGNARGETLLFLNPDARDPGDQFRSLWQALQSHQEAQVRTARQLDQHGRGQKVFDAFPSAINLLGPIRALLRLTGAARYQDARRCQDNWRGVDWVSGSALMIRRSAFEALDGWCDDFWMYVEDVDLCRRARDRGMQVAFTAEAVIEHRHGGTSRSNLEAAAMTRSEVIISKHLYASRHFGGLHAAVFHGLLVASRWPTLILARLIRIIWPGAPAAVLVRSMMTGHLWPYYLQVISSGDWRSPRVLDRVDSGE